MMDKDLLKLLGKDKKYIFIIDIIMLIGMLASIAITCGFILAIKEVYDESFNFLYPILLVSIGICVRLISSIISNYMKDYLGRKVKKELRNKAIKKIFSLGLREVDDLNMAGLTQVTLEGVEQLDLYYSNYLPLFFYSMLAPLLLFMISVFIDFRASLILLFCVPLIPMSIVMVSKYAKKIFAKYWGKYISMGGEFLDTISGLKELKIFLADERYNDKLNSRAEEFRTVTMKVLVMQLASTTIMDLVAYAGAGAGISMALTSASLSYISFYEALFFVLVAVEFFLPMRALGSAFHVAMNGASAGKKLLKLLNKDELKWGNNKIKNKEIKFKNVIFSYDGENNVINDINLDFKENKITAIVGKSGSGKSTIVKLIMGLIRPDYGDIYVGKDKISELERNDYYHHLGIVSYNSYLFNDTIKNNFKVANNLVTDEEIYKYLKMVNMYDFVMENGGLDKIISEDSSNISGGERQRLVLAINLSAKKDIYVFDEATSNIDKDSEEIIINNIKNLKDEATIIIISHRLENVVFADNIYYLEDGIIKEEGNHKLLIHNNLSYANLYKTQKALEEGYKEVL